MQLTRIDDSWYNRPPGVSEEISAGGIVVRVENTQILIALIREGRDLYYVLPKGRLEPGETLEQAAHREIAEETGLSELQLIANLGARERLSYSKKTWKKTHYFLFITHQIHGTPSEEDQDNELHWSSIDNLPNLLWPEQKMLIDLHRDQIVAMVRGQ
jgi:ADP-ribose pyrophosphatase YjhB (NUDIX family)